MKIKKTVLRSIIKAVIREQSEYPSEAAASEQDLTMAYQSIVEIATSSYWCSSVSLLVSRVVTGIFVRAVEKGSFSMLTISKSADKVLSNDKILNAVHQITKNALSQSLSYQKSSPAAKHYAEASMRRVMKSALSSFLGSELSFIIMYDMSNISEPFAIAFSDLEDGEADPRFRNTAVTRETQIIAVDDVEKTQSEIKSLDLKKATYSAWEYIMKFIGMSHMYENTHFTGIVDMRDFGGMDEEDYLGFGATSHPPF